MPTRSYYFPKDFAHLEVILRAESSGFSDEAAAYFRALGLPPIPDAGALPLLLGISPKTLFSIRRNSRRHYRSFFLLKKDGTKREIDTPRTYLKVIQWWILDNLFDHVNYPGNIFGFVAGRSAIQNATFHFGAKHILNVDIRRFFPSVTITQVFSVFRDLGYSGGVSEVLSELCCIDGHLPQGAPTSPAIANLVLGNLDKELSALADVFGLKYSRYADDLTFSSSNRIDDEFLVLVQHSVNNAGFTLKPDKTRYASSAARMEVTGVVINEKMQPDREWRKRTRAKLHHLSGVPRLTRRNVSYLLGIRGMANQYPESPQMQALSKAAVKIFEEKSNTVIGRGNNPILPSGLTLHQAEILARLAPRVTNQEIAVRLGITEAAVKRRLQEAFRKIGVSNRSAAARWAVENL